jgi:hypothetical protein
MHLVHKAAGLLSRELSERAEKSRGFLFTARFCDPADRQNDHRAAGWLNIASERRFISSGVTFSMRVATDQQWPKGSVTWP